MRLQYWPREKSSTAGRNLLQYPPGAGATQTLGICDCYKAIHYFGDNGPITFLHQINLMTRKSGLVNQKKWFSKPEDCGHWWLLGNWWFSGQENSQLKSGTCPIFVNCSFFISIYPYQHWPGHFKAFLVFHFIWLGVSQCHEFLWPNNSFSNFVSEKECCNLPN